MTNNAIKNFWANLKREKLLAVTNIIVITVSFLLLGVFLSIVFVSQSTLKYLENQAQVTAFFKDDFTEENILNVKEGLEQDERVLQIDYISKEAAFKLFTELNKDEPVLIESISADILPASLEIKTKDVDDLATLASELAAVDGVEDVKFFEDVVEKFKSVSTVAYIIGIALVVMFLIISYSVVLATLRTTITSKGTELEIQRLVGASDAYIKTPIILQALFYGVISGVLASVVLVSLGIVLSGSGLFGNGLLVPFLPNTAIPFSLFSAVISVLIIVSGIVLGYLGSATAVRKYLKY